MKSCYLSKKHLFFFFFWKLTNIAYQKDRKKHKLSFFPQFIMTLHTLKLYILCFSDAKKQNFNTSALRLLLKYSTSWMSDGFDFVGVFTRVSADFILYFQGTLSGCRPFI